MLQSIYHGSRLVLQRTIQFFVFRIFWLVCPRRTKFPKYSYKTGLLLISRSSGHDTDTDIRITLCTIIISIVYGTACLCIFIAMRARGPTKKGLLIMQFQCIMGKGSRRAADLNLAGSTYVTRLLYTVLRQHHYNRQKSVLYKLLQHWVNDWKDAFHDGICVSVAGKSHTIYPIVLGLKGDWPALIKMGRLNRHFGRDAPASQNPPGICHLCRAGRLGFPWHLNDINAAWLLDPHAQDVEPWNAPSPLVEIPSDSGASFYMIDVFHTLHKGVFGDFAASALDP